MSPEDQTARRRFFIIGAVRLAGAVTIALAVATLYGRIEAVPPIGGYILLALGVIEMILLPQLLVARWKSPPAG